MAWHRWIQLIPLRARSLFRRRRVEADLEEELRFHLAMTTSRYTQDGVSEGEAERRARRDFGGLDQAKEGCRDALRMRVIDDVIHDVRYAVRSFRRSPAFTLVALVSVAIAVGVNCAAFSWADTLLLRPLPIARPSEVVTVGSKLNIEGAGTGASVLRTSYPEYVDLCERSRSFDGLAAYTGVTAGLATTAGATPILAVGDLVSGNFFSVLGVEPMLGRAFRREEGAVPGRDAVVILGHGLWERQFGGDPDVVGRLVHLDGIAFTVIGVLPPWFTGVEQPLRPEFYAPIMMWPRLRQDNAVQPLEARDLRYLTIKARLKGGVGLEQAQTELALISHDVERDHPESERGRAFAARTERQNRIAELPPLLMLNVLLMTLAAAVLLVACANLAGLLTSRAPVRAREMATRLALGAGRGRLMRQLLTESVLLAIAGGASGLAAAASTVRAFQLIQFPTDMPLGYTFQFDGRAAAFGLVITLGSILLFGLWPAMLTSRVAPMTVMKRTESTIGRGRSWGRGFLVVGQVAVSVVLLVIASFIYRAFRLELTSGPGYRIDHLLMMTFNPGLVHYSDAEALRFYDTLAERARAVPQVKSVALASSVPMQTFSLNASTIVPEGYQLPPDKENVFVLSAVVDDRYFETMRIPVVRGRGFRVEDSASAPRVAILNEVMARHYWPDQDPIGKRFRLIDERTGSLRVEVVGVAKTSKYVFLAEPPTDYVYFSFRQGPPGQMILLAESEGDPATLVAPLRRMAKTIDAQQPIYNIRTMEEFYQVSTVGVFTAIIRTVATMGVMGLGLALVGLYGLVAYAASRRTKEIGIRIAIGADRGAVLRLVLRQGVSLAVAGLAAGLVASVVAGTLLQRAFPDGDSRSDVASFATVALTVLVVTMLAAYIPARRASRIDPITALRYE